MKNNNFTFSKPWKEAFPIRFNINKIVKINNICFYQENEILKCQHYFDFEVSKNSLQKMQKYINNNFKFKFNYINEGKLFDLFKTYCKNNNYKLSIVDEWQAPQLILNDIELDNYLKNNCNNQTKKNYKKYLAESNKYHFCIATSKNINKLWNDVLYIDYNSWKGKNKCDMKSLDREDLQYIFMLIGDMKNSSLKVMYKEKKPLAYSLMFRTSKKEMWYAVKWGASNDGRKFYAGIFCLFNHLEYLSDENKKLYLDFWGRRSSTYDNLKNKEIKRYHFEITK
ncbi:MAG: hypothetical protein PHQ89_00200 [Bacilli bacterium]|nr:hypothetical protein [Bacilli bacterium]